MKHINLFILVAFLMLGTARPLFSQAAQSDHMVTQADMERWKKELSNWGRWGKDDQMGTINLITPEKRKQAAALIRDGFQVSLARNATYKKEADVNNPWEHRMVSDGSGRPSAGDYIGIRFHGISTTHLDSLGHHFMYDKMYNGYERSRYVSMETGLGINEINNMKGGIFTRAILMDIPRLKGVEYLEPGTPIYVEDLEAWEKKAGVKVSPGDAVFIRTGRWVHRAKMGPLSGAEAGKRAGLDASVIPWLRERDIAILGSEASLSVEPNPPTANITNPDDYSPVHNFVLVVLGMPLLDACDLTALSDAAAARNRWEFLLTVAPLPLPMATGSPVNPIAVF